jgi:hypothetical protein
MLSKLSLITLSSILFQNCFLPLPAALSHPHIALLAEVVAPHVVGQGDGGLGDLCLAGRGALTMRGTASTRRGAASCSRRGAASSRRGAASTRRGAACSGRGALPT